MSAAMQQLCDLLPDTYHWHCQDVLWRVPLSVTDWLQTNIVLRTLLWSYFNFMYILSPFVV